MISASHLYIRGGFAQNRGGKEGKLLREKQEKRELRRREEARELRRRRVEDLSPNI